MEGVLKIAGEAADMYNDGEVGHMKIYDRNLTGMGASEANRPQEAQKPESTRESRSAAGMTGDRVEFSGNLSALSKAVSAEQAARSSRIQALAAQVHSGTYQPDTKAISRAMVSDAVVGR